MESHALHGDGIYYESGDKLWVNLYAPSTADWAAAGVKLFVDTGFPEGESVTITLTLQSSREFTLALRRPSWAGEGFSVKINGEALAEDLITDNRIAAYGRQADNILELDVLSELVRYFTHVAFRLYCGPERPAQLCGVRVGRSFKRRRRFQHRGI